jgi:hypothetical protein
MKEYKDKIGNNWLLLHDFDRSDDPAVKREIAGKIMQVQKDILRMSNEFKDLLRHEFENRVKI